MLRRLLAIAALGCAAPVPVLAADSPALMGALGLITVPSARMDPAGTVRAQVGMAEPYVHATASVQLADPLSITLRQSARSSSLTADPDRLYPGVDLRLRLLKESAYVPEMTLGLQSALGHKRMAAEYLTFSKRYENWDFTGGMAWGRLGSAAHMSNPLKVFSSHFGKARALDGEMPNGPEDWFTGEDIGFFAGVEYDTPWIKGLSLKAEWGADRYVAEAAAFGHNAPDPWAVGFSYAPRDWVSVGAGLIGGDRVMGRLSLRTPVSQWPFRGDNPGKPAPVRPVRAGIATPGEITQAAAAQGIILADTNNNQKLVWTRLETDPHLPVPQQIGRAARAIANSGGTSTEAMEITPVLYGLRGPSVRVLRRDTEQLFARHNGSPQEMWRNTSFNGTDAATRSAPYRARLADARENLRLIWDTQASLSEEDNGVLYRTALIAETRQQLTRSLMAGAGLRLNLASNLRHLNEFRPVPALPVREDADLFTANTVNLERAYLGWLKTPKTDLHVMFAGGYLEEMYGGVGGEVLYRPFGKAFAIGAEAWQVFKRDPYSYLSQGFTGDHILTAHINAWYEMPDSNLTFHARAGRYLAGDTGGTLAVRHRFTQGGYVEAFATATNGADIDPFGGATHIYSGMKLVLPVGSAKYIPRGSEVRMTAAQMGRSSGQALDRPLPLYDLTDDFSLRQIATDWNSVAD